MIFDDVEYTKSDLVNTPEGKMLIGILFVALIDLTKEETKIEKPQKRKKNAIKWILEGNDVLKVICWLIDVDMKKVQEVVHNKEAYNEIYKTVHLFLMGRKKR